MTLSSRIQLHAFVHNLRVYLTKILENAAAADLLRDGDSPIYEQFLNGSYVALKEERAVKLRAVSPMVYIQEVIRRAQRDILRRPRHLASNVITAGYQLARRQSSNVATENYAVVNYYVNTIVTALQAPEWDTLFRRVGEDAMLHLLKDTSIFVPLPNHCFCQMTGQPIVNVKGLASNLTNNQVAPSAGTKRKILECEANERPKKRAKLYATTSFASADSRGSASGRKSTKQPPRPPSDINIPRVRLFYSRPDLVPNSKTLMVGLPSHHVLNKLNPSYIRKPRISPEDWIDPDPKEQMNSARHLAKYVFPRQHGLSNPFDSPLDGQITLYDIRRELEIQQRGFIKTPKRVRPALDLLEKLIWRHGKCAYKPLRDKLCPSKIDHKSSLGESEVLARKNQFLELMSEHAHSSQPRSQEKLFASNISIDSEGASISAIGLTQATDHVKSKPRCVDFAVSNFEVYRYAIVVTEEVIPMALWGCKKNFNVIAKYIKEFIDGRRHETMSLHHVLQKFGTSECDWVCSDNPAAQKHPRVSVTDSLKRRELIEEFIYWYFSSFLLPLLRTSFYATESSMFRNRILYFRQDDWKALCEPLIDRLTAVTFKEMDPHDAKELLRQRKLGFSFVRLLPKEAGVRPIVNLRRKSAKGLNGHHESINRILKVAFEILTYEKEAKPEWLGESVFGPDEVYRKLKAFKSRLNGGDSSKMLPKLYFVKVDVKACFDTIDQSKLLEIIRDLLSQDTYTIRRYGTVTPVLGKSTRRYLRKAVPPDDHLDFFPYATELASLFRGTIFVDQVPYHSQNKQEILALLEEHITENIVKIGNTYYRQVVGIPQGSVLSSLLCSFAYGDLERRKFKFSGDPESVLLRLVDDYLLITKDILKARKFLQMMSEGHPEYGCTISQDKTKTNFDFGSQVSNVTSPHQKEFPWCGYLINMANLAVSSDYSRFNQTYVRDSLTVVTGREPGVTFTTKMLQMSKHKSHPIFCDTDLNSVQGVYVNIYANFLLSAMKMHQYLRVWNIDLQKSAKLIHDTVDQMIRYTHSTMSSKISNKVARDLDAKFDAKKKVVIWLGTHAFHTILSRFPEKYYQAVTRLELELSRPQHSALKREFSVLVQEGLKTFSHVRI